MDRIIIKTGLTMLIRKPFFCLFFLLLSGVASAQMFSPQEIARWPKGLDHRAYIVEINNDANKDILFFRQVNADSAAGFTFLQTNDLEFTLTDTIAGLASADVFVTDFDNNGRVDIIVLERLDTGYVLSVLSYDDTLSVRRKLHESDSILQFAVDDMDNDGRKDLCLVEMKEGKLAFSLYLHQQDSSFKEHLSVPGISTFLITSLENDGYKDLALYSEAGGEVSLVRNRNFESGAPTSTIAVPYLTQWALSDINHDGRADILVTTAQHDTTQLLSLTDTSGTFSLAPLFDYPTATLFLSSADFTNDGLYDILLSSKEESVLLAFDTTGMVADTLRPDSASLFSAIHIGDVDRNGRLDWLGLVEEQDSVVLRLLVNDLPEENNGPLFVSIVAPKTIGENTIFSWYHADDDKTPSKSLTYDFFIGMPDEGRYIISSDHDLDGTPSPGARNISRHGYTLFDTVYVVKDLEVGRYQWGLAGVDNAFYSQTDITDCTGGAPCSNDFFVNQCLDISRDEAVACRFDTLTLQFGDVGDSVVWSSVRRGEIGYGNTLHFPVTASDEVYALAFPKRPCDDPTNACMKNFSVTVEMLADTVEVLTDPLVICPDSTFTYELAGEFEEIAWFTDSTILSESNEVQFNPHVDVPLIVKTKKAGHTCFDYDTLVVNMLQKPEVNFFLLEEDSVCRNSLYPVEIHLPDSLRELMSFSVFADGVPLDSSHPQIVATQPTTLTVSALYAGCFALSDTLKVKVIELPVISVEGTSQIFPGHSTVLTASGADRYEWSPARSLSSPSSASTTATPEASTTYSVTGWSEEGCEGQATFRVEITPSVYVPELFTPNDDGHNDHLVVHGADISRILFSLFDGNGRRIFSSESVPEITLGGWDGKVNGRPVTPGTYIWTVEGEFTNGTPVTFNGKNRGELKIVH